MSTRRSGGFGEWTRFVLAAVAIAASSILVTGQITVPNTFVNGTSADAPQVNANFNALAANALNRTGGTMTGTLTSRDVTPSADNTYALGSVAFKWKLPFIAGGSAGQFLQTDGAGTTSWASASPVGACGLRLTLTSGTPITTADVTAATSVFVSPIAGGQCTFYDGSSTWTLLAASEVTVAVPATTSTLYDVFCFNNSGTMACDAALAWTNDTTRATALALQNNVYVKSGATTRRYIGSFRTTTVSGQTEDSAAKRYVWSYYNRDRRLLFRAEPADNWNYTTATLRQANANTSNQVDFVVGVQEANLCLDLRAMAGNTVGTSFSVAIGEDSTTTAASNQLLQSNIASVANQYVPISARLDRKPAIGRHFYVWLEQSAAVGTTTWDGDNGSPGLNQSGLSGWIEG